MSNVPTWWEAALLGLAAFRSWKLIGEDVILDGPRAWIVSRMGDHVETLIECPWCAGAYLSAAWWIMWEWQPHMTLVVSTPFALSAIVGLIAIFSSD